MQTKGVVVVALLAAHVGSVIQCAYDKKKIDEFAAELQIMGVDKDTITTAAEKVGPKRKR